MIDPVVKVSLNPWSRDRWEQHYGIRVEAAIELVDNGLLVPYLRSEQTELWDIAEHSYMSELIQKSTAPGLRYDAWIKAKLSSQMISYDDLCDTVDRYVSQYCDDKLCKHLMSSHEEDQPLEALRAVYRRRILWTSAKADSPMDSVNMLEDRTRIWRGPQDRFHPLSSVALEYVSTIQPEVLALGRPTYLDSTARKVMSYFGRNDLEARTNGKRDYAISLETQKLIASVVSRVKPIPWPDNSYFLDREVSSKWNKCLLNDRETIHRKGSDFASLLSDVLCDIESGKLTEEHLNDTLARHNEIATIVNKSCGNVAFGGRAAGQLLGMLASPLCVCIGKAFEIVNPGASERFQTWLRERNLKCFPPAHRLVAEMHEWKTVK